MRIATVVCLGDSFHDRDAIERLPKSERCEIDELTRRTRFVWIAGNHDPALVPSPAYETADILSAARAKMYAARLLRPRPRLDDKILTAWNGLMIAAFARAARALFPQDQTAPPSADQALRDDPSLKTGSSSAVEFPSIR